MVTLRAGLVKYSVPAHPKCPAAGDKPEKFCTDHRSWWGSLVWESHLPGEDTEAPWQRAREKTWTCWWRLFFSFFNRSSHTISAKSSEMFIALRRSATLSNSLNSAAGERALTHTSVTLLFCHVWFFFVVVFIAANSQRLFKAWKCGTPTLQPSLTSSPPTPTSWSSCRTPPFVSGKYDLSQQ